MSQTVSEARRCVGENKKKENFILVKRQCKGWYIMSINFINKNEIEL